MKIIINGEHKKTIPQKYSLLGGVLEEMFKDANFKRLTDKERFDLEVLMLRRSLKKYEAELIKDKEPVRSEYVRVRDGEDYFVLIFGNVKVKCTEEVYRLCEHKGESKSYN